MDWVFSYLWKKGQSSILAKLWRVAYRLVWANYKSSGFHRMNARGVAVYVSAISLRITTFLTTPLSRYSLAALFPTGCPTHLVGNLPRIKGYWHLIGIIIPFRNFPYSLAKLSPSGISPKSRWHISPNWALSASYWESCLSQEHLPVSLAFLSQSGMICLSLASEICSVLL